MVWQWPFFLPQNNSTLAWMEIIPSTSCIPPPDANHLFHELDKTRVSQWLLWAEWSKTLGSPHTEMCFDYILLVVNKKRNRNVLSNLHIFVVGTHSAFGYFWATSLLKCDLRHYVWKDKEGQKHVFFLWEEVTYWIQAPSTPGQKNLVALYHYCVICPPNKYLLFF